MLPNQRLIRLRSFAFTALCLLGLAVSIGVSSCGRSDEDENMETATHGTFQLVADEVLRPAIDSLVEGFMKENPKAKITVKYVSAGEAVQELLNKQARAVIVARGLTSVEQGLIDQYKLVLPEFEMAQDGIGCIVSASNPTGAIAMSDLRTIVSDPGVTWSDLRHTVAVQGRSPATGPINRVLPAYPSSTEYVLDSIFLKPNEMVAGKLTRYASTDSIIARVRTDAHAIGFIGSSWKHWLESRGDTTVKLIPIIPADSSSRGVTKPIMLHLAYIYQGLYPLTTRVSGFTFENPNTLPRGFLAYAMTAHGQTVFKNFEILPKTQIIKIVPSK